MIVQKWQVMLEESSHEVEYRYSRFPGKTTLIVDGEEFTVKGHTFGLGVRRNEQVIVGMTQGALSIDKKGYARLTVREAVEVREM